jgi:glutaminase
MRENERRKTNFDQESSKRIECFDADLRFYDESGEFTIKWDYRAKVVLAVLSLFLKSLVVATWSPKLNKKGNSELGMHALNY